MSEKGQLRTRVGSVLIRAKELFPLTPLGVGLIALATLALKFIAYEELDLVLFVGGYGALALVALSFLAVGLSAIWRYFDLRRVRNAPSPKSLALETGRALPTGFQLPSRLWFPLVRTRWDWLTPNESQATQNARHGALHESVWLNARGEWDSIQRRLVIEDVFSLARISLRETSTRPVRAQPHIGALKSVPPLRAMAAGDEVGHPYGVPEGDRIDLRRYAPGDPARLIHWKAFARSRKLVVRVPERALSHADRTVAYLVSGELDEASAAAARTAIFSGALGAEWSFGADGSPGTRSPEDALRAVARSKNAESPGGGLESFLAKEEREGPVSLVLFLPPVLGAWREPVSNILRRRRSRTRVIIGIDGLRETKRGRAHRLLLKDRESGFVSAVALQQTCTELEGLRAEISIIDRKTGRVFKGVPSPKAKEPVAAKLQTAGAIS